MARKVDELCTKPTEPGDVINRDQTDKTYNLETLSPRIRTVDEALAKAEIDLGQWEVERAIVNSWEVGAKGPNGNILVTPLWQVKVWLKVKASWSVDEFRQLLREDFKALKPSYRKPKVAATTNEVVGVLCIFDHHFGKLAWEEESGSNYDLKIAQERYIAASNDLLGRFKKEKPERIVYVVGNDFLHVDQGRTNSTTKGTQVDTDGRWQKAYRVGLQCAIRTADLARTIAPVDIVCVSGNHDAEKLFCLGEALRCRYEDCEDVTVDNSANEFSYYRYGVNLIGFTHGDGLNDAKKKQLANKMAVDCPVDWSETKCREWFLGHLHRERETVWEHRQSDSVQKVTIRECPALCGSDAWHTKNMYMSSLGAELHMYRKDSGRYGYLTFSPVE